MAGRMERLQFYLEPELDRLLEKLADRLGLSKSELIREGVRAVLRERLPVEDDPLMGIVGLGQSEAGNLSEEHDRYLAEVKLGRGSKDD